MAIVLLINSYGLPHNDTLLGSGRTKLSGVGVGVLSGSQGFKLRDTAGASSILGAINGATLVLCAAHALACPRYRGGAICHVVSQVSPIQQHRDAAGGYLPRPLEIGIHVSVSQCLTADSRCVLTASNVTREWPYYDANRGLGRQPRVVLGYMFRLPFVESADCRQEDKCM